MTQTLIVGFYCVTFLLHLVELLKKISLPSVRMRHLNWLLLQGLGRRLMLHRLVSVLRYFSLVHEAFNLLLLFMVLLLQQRNLHELIRQALLQG